MALLFWWSIHRTVPSTADCTSGLGKEMTCSKGETFHPQAERCVAEEVYPCGGEGVRGWVGFVRGTKGWGADLAARERRATHRQSGDRRYTRAEVRDGREGCGVVGWGWWGGKGKDLSPAGGAVCGGGDVPPCGGEGVGGVWVWKCSNGETIGVGGWMGGVGRDIPPAGRA